uniref:G-protein coupled receptors family 2 profile 2 domain-containing protein n=1 Tax=Electrophorus electricus TaxID=8005 RepID=A0AAY5F4X3_ELEEL
RQASLDCVPGPGPRKQELSPFVFTPRVLAWVTLNAPASFSMCCKQSIHRTKLSRSSSSRPSDKESRSKFQDKTQFLSNVTWQDMICCSECTGMIVFSHLASMQLAITMSYLAVVGHTLSVVSLVISMFIFSYFKCLSCQRISLHKNMFMSFILNSILMVIWFNIINKSTVSDSVSIVCKIFLSLILYTHCSNYFWMLCEGIYLHTLIIVAMFMGEQHLGWYYLLGWGFPVIPTVIHAIAPCRLCRPLQVNLFFLMNIVRVLITKLRVTHKTESRVYMKAVRATLILVPLMGIHFILVPLQPEGKLALAIYEFLMHIFTHFQVGCCLTHRPDPGPMSATQSLHTRSFCHLDKYLWEIAVLVFQCMNLHFIKTQ